MPRSEFPKSVKRLAFERSGGQCEGVGADVGLPPDQRCGNGLDRGVEYDHILSCYDGGQATLENCAALCPSCHRYKTGKVDAPRIAKIRRNRDKTQGIRRRSSLSHPRLRKKLNGEVVEK